jgi:CrcB protein
MNLLYVAIGGALGSVARYLMQTLIGKYSGVTFPYGTLIVNISGSIIMGLFIGWLAGRQTLSNAQDLRLFIAVGILGGYTTFSSFSLEAITLYEEGKVAAMAAYIIASVVISLLGLLAGLRLMRAFA